MNAKLYRKTQGSALIMVLGMMALMLVMAIAFSIYMRTGMAAAGGYRQDVLLRQMMPVAINQALVAITRRTPDYYPSWDVLLSEGTGGAASNMITDAVRRVLPLAPLSNTNPIPQWIVPSDLKGLRVAFVVLNCSGLLDANYAGGTNRSFGSSPAEIQIGTMPEVVDFASLTNHRPYLTIQQLTTNALLAGSSNFVCYSMMPWVRNGVGTAPALLSGSAADLKLRQPDIEAKFILSGLTDARGVFEALIDYVDTNDVPERLDSYCTEAVPMINEVVAQVTFSGPITNMTLQASVTVELSYPFVTPAAANYYLAGIASFRSDNAFPVPGNATNTRPITIGSPYSLLSGVCRASVTTNFSSFAAVTPQTVSVAVSLEVRSGSASGQVVDRVPASGVLEIPLDVSGLSGTYVISREIIDPRYNWNTNDWKVANPLVGTPARENSQTLRYRVRDPSVDGDAKMHVANAPLRSVAELSYLPRDKDTRWSTIRLFPVPGKPVDPVLDYFAINTNTLKGVVNPNTRSKEVMSALFQGMIADEYPGGPASAMPTPQVLADAWVDLSNQCSTLSQLGVTCTNVLAKVAYPSDSLFRKESLLRNLVGLVHPRQQYFIVCMSMQGFKTVKVGLNNVDIPGARIYATAEIWRDPLLPHNVMIQNIMILNE